MAEKRSIPARDVLADLRIGMTDDELMVKYRLSDNGLRSLKNKLFTTGLLAQAQLDNSQSIGIPQENDTKVLARKIAEAVKAGRPDEEIARTFGRLSDKLSNVFPLLIKNGYLTQEDYDRRESRREVPGNDITPDAETAAEKLDAPDEPATSTVNRVRSQTALRADSKTMARKIADAVRAGWSDEEIATVFDLPTARLANVFAALIEYGYLNKEDCDRPRSRRGEIIDIELDVESATANIDVSVDHTPFAVIRGRTLLASLVLALILALTVSGIIWAVWGIKLESPLGTALSTVLDQVFLFLCMAYLLHLAKLSPGALLGHNAAWPLLGRSMLVSFPLIALAIAGNYLLYLPLSYLVPRFVDWCLFCRPPMIVLTTDYAGMSANLLNFFVIVLMAPVVEEFFFRGLLLTRWSVKWNVRTGIFASSLVFALGHPANVVGAFFIGYVLSILYIQTKSLFVPISIHIANNGIAWILTGVNTIFGEPYARNTLAEWQSFWWVGLVAGLIVAPWVIRFLRRHVPKPDWRVPYLALQETT